jgi:hypothetical protein
MSVTGALTGLVQIISRINGIAAMRSLSFTGTNDAGAAISAPASLAGTVDLSVSGQINFTSGTFGMGAVIAVFWTASARDDMA